MSYKYKRLFVLNEPNAPRLNPALACEIGLNESIVLLQIEFWISISDHFYDGRRWTYQSIRDMQEKAFPFWSISTINRAINRLIKKGYLIEGNYNKKSYDKTRWFALNFEKLQELKSISIKGADSMVFHNETGDDTPLFQNDTRSNQNDTRSNQNETTIPETTTDITTETTSSDDDDVFNFYQQNFGTISSYLRDYLISLIKDYGEALTIEAMKIAVENKARSIKYVNAVLRNWASEGIKTVDDIKAAEKERKRKKDTPAGNGFRKAKNISGTVDIDKLKEEFKEVLV